MVPKQVSYRFPGIDNRIISIQRGKVPIPNGNVLTWFYGHSLFFRINILVLVTFSEWWIEILHFFTQVKVFCM